MTNRKAKIKAFAKNYSRTLWTISGVLAGAAAATVYISTRPATTDGTSDGVSEELWEKFIGVAKEMDDAVAEHKANKTNS